MPDINPAPVLSSLYPRSLKYLSSHLQALQPTVGTMPAVSDLPAARTAIRWLKFLNGSSGSWFSALSKYVQQT